MCYGLPDGVRNPDGRGRVFNFLQIALQTLLKKSYEDCSCRLYSAKVLC